MNLINRLAAVFIEYNFMKRLCFLFTLLIGMICFAGSRAETPDLKENPPDMFELTSDDGMVQNLSIVSQIQKFEISKVQMTVTDQIQTPVMVIGSIQTGIAGLDIRSSAVQTNINSINGSEDHQLFRNPRDGLLCSFFS